MHVTHCITGLGTGGAEHALFRLATAPDCSFSSDIVSLAAPNSLSSAFQQKSLSLRHLGLRPSIAGGVSLGLAALELRRERRDILQGWMYHGNLAAFAFRRRGVRVAWGIRETLAGFHHSNPRKDRLIKVSAHLSRWVDLIVYNSVVSRDQHRQMGFQPREDTVIYNGINTEEFRPRPDLRLFLRNKLGFGSGTVVIGRFGRVHPVKGHISFVQAFAQVASKRSNVMAFIVGKGADDHTLPFWKEAYRLGVVDRIRTLGDRHDVADLFMACDIACSSSLAEAFPNVVAEAMACGVPTVSTDVGDSSAIVGAAGLIVPPDAPNALAQAIERLADDPLLRRRLSVDGRLRIEKEFTLSQMTTGFGNAYARLVKSRE